MFLQTRLRHGQKAMYSKFLVSGLIAVALVTGALATGALAQAQAPTRIKQHNAWGAYSHAGASGKVCYILSIPTQKEPADRDHGDVFFMLAKHPGQNVTFEPQFTAGYPFADNSKVVLDIDGKKFNMFTRGSNAWMENPAEEPAVVTSMRNGKGMKLTGKSRRGTETGYSFSLSGVIASLKEVQDCK